MWDCIDADGDEEDIAFAIEDFADECQNTLGLSYWPAERTCAEFEDDFNLYPYMGSRCWPECPFGERESSSGLCACENGYWNATCTAICPGGALEPCSGYGTCDTNSGECNCPLNKLQEDDCSVCSEGWYGANCEVAINEAAPGATSSLAMLGQLGALYTLDHLSYSVKTQGELLLLAISENVIIEGKFVTCYQNYSCVPFIGVRIGDSVNGFATVTVQSERVYNSKPMVYINDVQDTLDTPAYFDGFQLYRSNFFEIVIEVTNLLTVYIRNEGQYLHLVTEVPDAYVTQTSGMLSGGLYTNITDSLDHLYNADVPVFAICNDTSATQSASGTSSAATLTVSSYTQTYSGNNAELDMNRFIIHECDSVIYFEDSLMKYQTQGGYGLNFSKSSINHELNLDIASTEGLTIELLVKQNDANDSGVLFSYTSSSSQSLLLVSGQSSLEVHTFTNNNESVYDTEMALDANAWNKVIMAYDNIYGTATVYVIDKDATVSTTGQFTLDSSIFESTGTLTLGHWNAPSDSKQYNLPSGFDGSMENFMIWNVTIEDSQVSELWEMNPALASAGVLFVLQFDEGDGGLTSDNVANLDVALPEYPWKAPEWIISDLSYVDTLTKDFALTYFNNETWETESTNFCYSQISATDVIGLSDCTKTFFLINCLQNLAVTRSKTAGYNAILDAFKLGESQHGTSSSEIANFCSGISDSERNGTSCTTSCYFGFGHSNGTCTCFDGYYGSTCSGICPGSSDTPCSDRGVCQSDGSCKCWWNWNGAPDCSACSTDSSGDMTGPDCTILSTTSLSSSNLKVAAVSSYSYYMTFDGQQISFTGQTGAFLLFSSSLMGVDIHVYQVSCHYGSCVAAVSLASASNNIVIAPPGQGISPILFKNGKQIALDDISNTFDAQMSVTQNSLTEISVTVTGIGSITVTVLVQEQFLQASVLSSSTICQAGEGIFGRCNGNGMDYSAMSQSEINEYIVSNFRLSSSIILDALEAPAGDGSNITGYALKFDRTAGISLPISYPPGYNISATDFSLSLYYKPSSLGGYIMSYGKETTFAILNTDPITFQCDTTMVQSSISPDIDAWNQLIVTFNRSDNNIELFHFGADSKITREVVNFGCGNIFEVGGTIMLAEYMPSVGSDPYTFDSTNFVGIIDEISIWKNPIPSKLIYQAHLLSTKVSGFSSELSQLLSFTEGVGSIAYDEINGNNMVLPSAPWQAPKWIVSDLGLQPLRTAVSEAYSTTDIDPDVETACTNFFDSNTVSSNCGGVSAFIRWWYKQTCMITATNTENITDTTMTMVDYTSVCGVTGGNVDNIYTVMCALNVSKPRWLEQKCSACDFGFKEDGVCVCYYGYYGTSCNNVCPGGATNACNGHGECDKGGNCQCSGRWTGTACDTCDNNWSGDDCSIYMSTFDPLGDNATTLVAQVNMIGQLSSFEGTIVDMPLRGYFNLMSIQSLDVSLHGRFGVCSTDSALHVCLMGYVIEHDGESYYISYETYSGSSVSLMSSSDSNITLYDTLEFGDMTLKLISPTTMSMTMKGSGLLLKISSISDRLLSTISLPKTEWESRQAEIDGVLTSCDTEKAITAANCGISRLSLCADPSQSVPNSCKLNQTKESLSHFVNNSAYQDTDFMDKIEDQYLSTMESNCLKYSGSGVAASDISLPGSDFTIEMHAKPTTFGGIIMTYDADGKYVTLINHENGMIVALAGEYFETKLPLELNVWNQISLAWRSNANIFEVYLTNGTGVSTVKAVPISDNVFQTEGGTLTLGQFPDDVGAGMSMGNYKGYIDEVRVWSRPHNPTIITNNWRTMITDDTSDVWHSWTFNEGVGYTAFEDKQGHNMVALDITSQPSWAKSSLDLSEDKDLDAPRLTTEDELSAAALQEAQEMCDNMISNFSLSVVGSSMDVLLDVYEALCVQELTSTGDEAQAEAVLAGAADMYISVANSSTNPLESLCNIMTSLSTYIGASGDTCTTCVFGDVYNGTCVCYDTHWGTTCNEICPVGLLGACNTYGICDEVLGTCKCHPRHYAGASSVSDYWEAIVASTTLDSSNDYTCDSCSDNWYGKACEFSKASPTSTNYYYGVMYGSYITNFEGVSYPQASPGVFTVFETTSAEMQALFVPCPGDNKCRMLQEVAVKSSGDVVTLQHVGEGQNVTLTLNDEDIVYPTTTSENGLSIEWSYMEYIKIQFGKSSLVAFDSDMGLVVTVKASPSDAKENLGVLGKPDDDWLTDFKCVEETKQLDEDELTAEHAGLCSRDRFGVDPSNAFINHSYAQDSLSSGGYALSLVDGEGFTVSGFSVEQALTKFSHSIWIKAESHSKKRSTASFPLLTMDVGTDNIEFRVSNGYIEIEWDAVYNTTISVDLSTWYYLAFSWKDDGTASVYLISTQKTQEYNIPSMNVGGSINLEGVSVTSSSSVQVSYDCMRSWVALRSLNDAINDMNEYCEDSSDDSSMLLSMTFDEGNGTTTSMTTFVTNDGTNSGSVLGTVAGSITGKILTILLFKGCVLFQAVW